MTAAYSAKGSRYIADQLRVRIPSSYRPNKLAVGLTFTHTRAASKQGELSYEASTLGVYGTLDPLARTNRMKTFKQKNYRPVTIWRRK